MVKMQTLGLQMFLPMSILGGVILIPINIYGDQVAVRWGLQANWNFIACAQYDIQGVATDRLLEISRLLLPLVLQ